MDNMPKWGDEGTKGLMSIYMLKDGSWVGRTEKFGKEIVVREAKPEDCLVKLLTHDGK